MPSTLVLASGSPRRRELLENAGLRFSVRPADVDESLKPGELAEPYVRRLAEAKARAVWREGELTLGADTIVVVSGEILGKPANESEAHKMLAELSGRAHDVLTGYCVFNGERAATGVETTKVFFRPLSAREIAAYASSGEPLDKAGAYGIQGLASKFVERIEGCYFNVVGLPVARTTSLLDQLTPAQEHR